jgi:hypothetical protein
MIHRRDERCAKSQFNITHLKSLPAQPTTFFLHDKWYLEAAVEFLPDQRAVSCAVGTSVAQSVFTSGKSPNDLNVLR